MLKKNLGFTLVHAVVALAIVATVAGLVAGVLAWYDEQIEQAKEAGRAEVRAQVLKRDNEKLDKAIARIKELTDEKDKLEREHAAELTRLDKEKTDEIRKIENRKDRFVADVTAGRIRLFDPGSRHRTGCPGGGGNAEGQAVAAAGVGDGAGAGELSREFAAFLVSEANRADKVVEKVNFLQGYIRSALKTCNADR